MFGFNGKKTANIVYGVSLAVTFFITAVVFSLFFFIGESGIFSQHPATEAPVTPTQNESELNEKIEEIKNRIQKYDKMLADPYLTLVNKSNPLPDDYVQTALVSSSVNPAIKLESITELHFKEFTDAILPSGFSCILLTGYRTRNDQSTVYNSLVQSYANAGYTLEKAELMANSTTPKGGESDFETGYAFEITAARNMTADEMKSSALFIYAKENIYKYGFILRYPEGKTSVTGYDFNPFVFRYVGFCEGVNHAQYIYENNLTLEEYVDYLKSLRANAVYELEALQKG